MRSGVLAAAAAGIACGLAGPAGAAEETKLIEGEIVFELQNDLTHDADDPDAEVNDLFTKTEGDVNVRFLPEAYLNAHFTLEPVKDGDPGEDRYFEKQGVFVEVLALNYHRDGVRVYGGKFGPNFSIAYDAAPGIYGTDVAEDDIEIAERIGFGGSVEVGGGAYGTHALAASVFFLDTTALSESVFTNRGRTRLSDGGPSNTESLESFALAVDGGAFPGAPGLAYHVGFVRQAVDRVLGDTGAPVADIDDENRVVAAVTAELALGGDAKLTALLEYVRFWNAGGAGGEDRDYLTAAARADYGPWNLALAYTGRFVASPAGDSDDGQFQVSAGYTFDFGLEADVGWRYREDGGDAVRTFGAFLTYTLAF